MSTNRATRYIALLAVLALAFSAAPVRSHAEVELDFEDAGTATTLDSDSSEVYAEDAGVAPEIVYDYLHSELDPDEEFSGQTPVPESLPATPEFDRWFVTGELGIEQAIESYLKTQHCNPYENCGPESEEFALNLRSSLEKHPHMVALAGRASLVRNSYRAGLVHCYAGVKNIIYNSKVEPRQAFPSGFPAKAIPDFEAHGWRNLFPKFVKNPCEAPDGAVLLYSGGKNFRPVRVRIVNKKTHQSRVITRSLPLCGDPNLACGHAEIKAHALQAGKDSVTHKRVKVMVPVYNSDFRAFHPVTMGCNVEGGINTKFKYKLIGVMVPPKAWKETIENLKKNHKQEVPKPRLAAEDEFDQVGQ